MTKHAVILAGGSGTRLWPVSRQGNPKQFQYFWENKSLLQQTYQRLEEMVDVNNIWVVTNSNYRDLVREQLPQLRQEHIIEEPSAKNTAIAITLATAIIGKQDPQALIGVFPSDHYIGKVKVFGQAVNTLYKFISKNPRYIGLLGINPTEANPGLGYIQMGNQLAKVGHHTLFKVVNFHEKPQPAKAKEFFETWEYLWNGGYFFFKADVLLKKTAKLLPETFELIKRYLETNQVSFFEKTKPEQFDKAIIEKYKDLVVLPTDLDWSDLGNWSAIHQVLNNDKPKNNVVIGKGIDIDCYNCLVISKDRMIATVGISDVFVIDAGDAILICHRDKTHDVKQVVDILKSQGKKELI